MRIFAKHTFVFVLQWRPRCGWWTGRVLTRAAWRFSTNAAGGRCVTTPGTRRTGTWCAGCWDTEGPLMSTRPDASDSVRDAHHARRALEGSVAMLENKERVKIQQEMKKEYQIFPGWSSLSGVMLSVPYDAAGINIKVLWGKSCEPDVVKKSLRGRIHLPLSLSLSTIHHSASVQDDLLPVSLENRGGNPLLFQGPSSRQQQWLTARLHSI